MSLGAGQYLEWQGAEEAKFQGKEDHFQIVTNVPPPPPPTPYAKTHLLLTVLLSVI